MAKVRAVTMGEIQTEKNGPWKPAVLLLSEVDLSGIVVGILCENGELVKTPWDYRRSEFNGAFTVPQRLSRWKLR